MAHDKRIIKGARFRVSLIARIKAQFGTLR